MDQPGEAVGRALRRGQADAITHGYYCPCPICSKRGCTVKLNELLARELMEAIGAAMVAGGRHPGWQSEEGDHRHVVAVTPHGSHTFTINLVKWDDDAKRIVLSLTPLEKS